MQAAQIDRARRKLLIDAFEDPQYHLFSYWLITYTGGVPGTSRTKQPWNNTTPCSIKYQYRWTNLSWVPSRIWMTYWGEISRVLSFSCIHIIWSIYGRSSELVDSVKQVERSEKPIAPNYVWLTISRGWWDMLHIWTMFGERCDLMCSQFSRWLWCRSKKAWRNWGREIELFSSSMYVIQPSRYLKSTHCSFCRLLVLPVCSFCYTRSWSGRDEDARTVKRDVI